MKNKKLKKVLSSALIMNLSAAGSIAAAETAADTSLKPAINKKTYAITQSVDANTGQISHAVVDALGDQENARQVMGKMEDIYKKNSGMSSNEFKKKLVSLVNQNRKRNGLTPLKSDSREYLNLVEQLPAIIQSFDQGVSTAAAMVRCTGEGE